MKLVRPGIVLATAALAIVAPLSASAAAASPNVQPTASISGTIAGTAAAPIVDACVEADLPGGGHAATPTRTAADGSYTLSDLAAGQITFTVDPGCAGAPTWDYVAYRATVQVTGGVASTINVTLTLGGTISGKLFAPGSELISGVCVYAYTSPTSTVYSTLSDANGFYQLLGVPVGSYTVLFNDCNFVDNFRSAYYHNAQFAAQMTSVPVTAGADTPLADETFLQGGEVDVVVTYPGPTAANDVTVALQRVGTGDDMGYNAAAVSDGLGAFGAQRMYGVQPGTYRVAYESCSTTCIVTGYYPGGVAVGSAATVQVAAGSILTLTDQIGGTEPTYIGTNVSLNLSPNPVADGATTTLTAHVTTTGGQPVPTGDVVFIDGLGAAAAPVSVDSNGDALSVGPIGGTETLTATYVGDGTYSRSSAQVLAVLGTTQSGGGGGGGGGGGSASQVTATVSAGGSVSSDPAGTTPGASNPLVVGVTSPTGGTVTIDKTPPNTSVAHYTVLGVGATITAPPATTANPLILTFQVSDKTLPAGSGPADLTVFRDGVAVGTCTGAGATPDPCVASESTTGGVTTIVIRSSHASTWDVEAAYVGRAAGADRIATAVAVSQDSFPAGNAGAVVLARADDYPDALVGGPLAAAKNAPLLLTEGSTLPAATATELKRVLVAGGTVYVLGGTSAIPASVATQLTGLGYSVVRYSGADRYATAVAVAKALGSPTTVLLATGTNFPDALAAGPAAAHVHGAILLTDGPTVPTATARYLAGAHVTYAIGGPAAAAVPSATAILGADRYATAAAVATKFFPTSAVAGVATGASFPDALAGGAQLALMGGPLLLSSLASVPASTTNYLNADHGSLTNVYVYGGAAVLGTTVISQLTAAFGS